MKSAWLFIVSCMIGGFGGVVGSIAGAAFGKRGLFIGGFLGGVVVAVLTARIAVWRGWIVPHQFRSTAAGAAIGFLAAATVAVNTLSSPVGPVLSTLLIGGGAIVGARTSERRA
jgi:hypothetical protein